MEKDTEKDGDKCAGRKKFNWIRQS